MKIGIFDSGMGGLFLMRKIVKKLPQYDYLYLGDTKRTPYGNRSAETVYQFTKKAVDYLFKKNCQLIILACNTGSAQALRKIQREYLPAHYPRRRVLGVIVPTVEKISEADGIKRIGVLATQGTVESKIFEIELKKINPKIKIFQQAAPLLVPLVENNGLKWAEPILKEYLNPLIKKKVEVILLGCTHYPILKNKIRKIAGKKTKVFSQDELIPDKLADYLKRHLEIDKKLAKNRGRIFEVTDMTPHLKTAAKKWFGKNISLKLASI
jgi:glutamate racemase